MTPLKTLIKLIGVFISSNSVVNTQKKCIITIQIITKNKKIC